MNDAFSGVRGSLKSTSTKMNNNSNNGETFRIGKKVRKSSARRKYGTANTNSNKAPMSTALVPAQQIDPQADLEPILEESKALNSQLVAFNPGDNLEK